jgi:hypothetical protein
MKGDFTRRTFHSRDHYRGVLLQQGRVQLDADWNEQIEIQEELDRTTTRDTVGRHGGPLGDVGMEIVCRVGDVTGGCAGADLRISAGRYYVDGILCMNEEAVPLADQPDLPGVPLPTQDGRYVAYLDVWTEHVTALERPELREVALGGPDTATRSRTIWQVRLLRQDRASCPTPAEEWTPPEQAGQRGRLRARAKAPEDDPGPCVVPATAGYRRLENQLYRVEIHDGGAADQATFVWSRENGSVAARLLTVTDDTLTIGAPGRDERLGFARTQWIEVIDSARTRRGEPGFLGRLGDAAGTALTVAEWADGVPATPGPGELAVVRRWDSEGALPVRDALSKDWFTLEDGVQIQFDAGGTFRTGDYWLIPARTADLTGEAADPDLTGDVEWPREGTTSLLQAPVGIEHHFAVVALLDLAEGTWTRASDCRNVFPPLGGFLDLQYAGGDGQETMPGQELPQPLQVSVSSGAGPVRNAPVRFTAGDADGRLATRSADLAGSTSSEVTATTGADGIARCFWRPAPDRARPSQRVVARLAGSDASPVTFSATLSVAERVWFTSGNCAALVGVSTVQDALDRLVAARSVAVVGGNGQSGEPGSDLPLPAEVLVRSDCGPAEGAVVRFTVASGAVAADAPGLGSAGTTVDIATDVDGVARCSWRLGTTDQVQPLIAALVDSSAPVEEPTRVALTASLERGRDDPPGLHVTGVVLTGPPEGPAERLLNDMMTTGETLAHGLAVVLDGSPLATMVDGKPVLRVTVDLPYPFSQSDRDLWFPGQDEPGLIGTMPLTLDGGVALGNVDADPAITWKPSTGSADFLRGLLTLIAEFKRGDSVLCHLTLTGRAVADSADADRRVINGLALGRPGDDDRTDMELPTVDDVRGADFTMWFSLVPALVDLVVLPTRTGLLRLKTVRDAIDLSLPRDELRARLRAGVRVAEDREADLEAAERAASHGFRNGVGRRLVVVVDDRYADAAAVARDALGRIGIELEVIPTADPVTAVRTRTAAGEQVDGVVTDDASTRSITDLGGFTKPIRL